MAHLWTWAGTVTPWRPPTTYPWVAVTPSGQRLLPCPSLFLSACKTPPLPLFWGSPSPNRVSSGLGPGLSHPSTLIRAPPSPKATLWLVSARFRHFSLVRLCPTGQLAASASGGGGGRRSFEPRSSRFSLFQSFKKWQHPIHEKFRETFGSEREIQEKMRTPQLTTPCSAFVPPSAEVDTASF